METTVRKATVADRGVVASTLASAFADDPLMRWMTGVEDGEQRMLPFWRGSARVTLRKPDHETYLADDGASVAVWRGIDKWKVPVSEILPQLPGMVSTFRLRVPSVLRILTAIEKVHPKEPHYYLEFLGTRRDRQGKGSGSAVMAIMLERCDTEGVPAYLESSNPRNIPFYARHGFVERDVIAGPSGCPIITPMWREPRG